MGEKILDAIKHIDPAEVGNERRILVSELSGRSNIVAMAKKHHIENDPQLLERILDPGLESL